MIVAIVTRAVAADVTAVLRALGESPSHVHVVEPGQAGALLEEIARLPAAALVLDMDVRPEPVDVVRYRLARRQTRIVVLASGRRPGDAAVAGVCAGAEILDVCTEAGQIGQALDREPDLAAALRWRNPALVPDGDAGLVRERIVERRVAVGSHPVTILVAGIAGGVGTTTVACAIAAYTARLGHDTALVGIGPHAMLALEGAGGAWRPHLDTFPCAAGVGDLVRGRRYPYVVADAGVAPMGEEPHQVDHAAWRRSALPDVGVAPDVSVLVLPGAIWRYGQVRIWLERWPARHRLPDTIISGPHPRTRTEALGVIDDLCEQAQRVRGPVRSFPYLGEPHVLPPGDRSRVPAVDEVVADLLGDVLPDRAGQRRGLLGRWRR